MMKFVATVAVLFVAFLAGAAGQCYSNDMEIGSSVLNDATEFASKEECQHFCRTVTTSAFFTWDAEDPHSCQCFANTADTHSAEGKVSGPNYCGDTNVCCDRIAVVSYGGSIVDSEQSHVLGNYSVYGFDETGHETYQQEGENGAFMYFYDPAELWYIGAFVGVNAAYATNPGTYHCGEQIQKLWDHWSPSVNEWITDDTMTTYCI